MRPAHWSLLLLMVAACGAGTVDGLPLVEMAPPRLGEPLAPHFFARARTPEESAQWRSRIAAVALIGRETHSLFLRRERARLALPGARDLEVFTKLRDSIGRPVAAFSRVGTPWPTSGLRGCRLSRADAKD